MIEYRKLRHDDYEDILDISKGIWDGYDYLPLVFHEWVDDGGYFLGVVDADRNKVIGVGKLSVLYDKSGWLEGLRVHKDYRGQKLGRQISERVLDLAKGYLKEGKIKRIAFATHVSNIESLTLMKKLDFKVESELITAIKPPEKLDKAMKLEDFTFEKWTPAFEELLNLPYFKRRNNLLPLAYCFEELSAELYEEFMRNGNFVSINGYKGIYKLKEGPYFECMDETFDAIDTFMNYYLLRFNGPGMAYPVTSIIPSDEHLIKRFEEEGYVSWNEWKPDYLYFVFKE
jgi:GNAT superfamily N-acetyltransferase